MSIKNKGLIITLDELSDEWLDEMSGTGLNLLGISLDAGGTVEETMRSSMELRMLPEYKKYISSARKRGLRVEYEGHVINAMIPRRLFSVHSEWFRMDENGERTDDHNFCVSNKDALDYLSDRAEFIPALTPSDTGNYMLWLDDVRKAPCYCPECRKLSGSDQQLIAANAMLRGIRRTDPKANLCFLAYNSTMEVPTKVEPENGIFLEYAPIHRDCHKPLNDPDSDKNRAETATLRDLVSFFGTKNARALDYWMDNSLFSHWTKPPVKFELDEEVLRRDVHFYNELGFEAITSYAVYLGADYRELYGDVHLTRYGEILSEV